MQDGKGRRIATSPFHERRVRDVKKLLAGEGIHHRRTFKQRALRVTMAMPVSVIA